MNAPDPARTDIKVSVAMITYNQERLVAQAIEGVLMQQTDFAVELVIGEDCSTDGTRTIVRDYGERYPDRIRLLLPEHNLGIIPNFAATLNACRGEYLALCEGDDYWTDPLKLQKQVDFLDAHTECSMCFHDVSVLDESCPGENRIHPGFTDKRVTYGIEELLRTDFIATCSVLYRRGIAGELPPWFYGMPVGDWPLHLLYADRGRIGYLAEVMATLRIHGGGAWSGRSLTKRIAGHLAVYRAINRHFRFRYDQIIRHEISFNYYWLATEHLAQAKRGRAMANLIQALAAAPLDPGAPYPLLARMMLQALLGTHYRFIRAIKHGRAALQEAGGGIQEGS